MANRWIRHVEGKGEDREWKIQFQNHLMKEHGP